MAEGVKEGYCRTCDRFTPLLEERSRLVCGACRVVLLRSRGRRPRKEAYCELCEQFTPLLEKPLQEDAQHEFPWGDLVCGECHSILLTVRLNTSATRTQAPAKEQRMRKLSLFTKRRRRGAKSDTNTEG
jgi:hypothetical protein